MATKKPATSNVTRAGRKIAYMVEFEGMPFANAEAVAAREFALSVTSAKAAAAKASAILRGGEMKTNPPRKPIRSKKQDLRIALELQRAGHPRKAKEFFKRAAVASNPAKDRAEVKKAAALYTKFTGHDAEAIGRVKVNPLPRVGVAIGEIDGVLYSTVRDGKAEKYIHQFAKADKPLFVVSPDGKGLFLVGGRYTFTERGIVDRSDKSR